eukprot:GFUD01071087.1.p2 GENE.GFUD01071087.1~~GFUD01071087.1.p2  ORF type:complete len:147 (-),score=43.64 GFUD01071087.1:57-497(-)
MFDYLFLPFKSTSPMSTDSSTASSRKSSISSSIPDFRPIHSEIIKRNLIRDFQEATSLPMNVPIHRLREASRPSTPMREEFDRCTKQLPFSLASKLFSVTSLSDRMEEEEEFSRGIGEMAEKRNRKTQVREKKNENLDDLMFQIDL